MSEEVPALLRFATGWLTRATRRTRRPGALECTAVLAIALSSLGHADAQSSATTSPAGTAKPASTPLRYDLDRDCDVDFDDFFAFADEFGARYDFDDFFDFADEFGLTDQTCLEGGEALQFAALDSMVITDGLYRIPLGLPADVDTVTTTAPFSGHFDRRTNSLVLEGLQRARGVYTITAVRDGEEATLPVEFSYREQPRVWINNSLTHENGPLELVSGADSLGRVKAGQAFSVLQWIYSSRGGPVYVRYEGAGALTPVLTGHQTAALDASGTLTMVYDTVASSLTESGHLVLQSQGELFDYFIREAVTWQVNRELGTVVVVPPPSLVLISGRNQTIYRGQELGAIRYAATDADCLAVETDGPIRFARREDHLAPSYRVGDIGGDVTQHVELVAFGAGGEARDTAVLTIRWNDTPALTGDLDVSLQLGEARPRVAFTVVDSVNTGGAGFAVSGDVAGHPWGPAVEFATEGLSVGHYSAAVTWSDGYGLVSNEVSGTISIGDTTTATDTTDSGGPDWPEGTLLVNASDRYSYADNPALESLWGVVIQEDAEVLRVDGVPGTVDFHARIAQPDGWVNGGGLQVELKEVYPGRINGVDAAYSGDAYRSMSRIDPLDAEGKASWLLKPGLYAVQLAQVAGAQPIWVERDTFYVHSGQARTIRQPVLPAEGGEMFPIMRDLLENAYATLTHWMMGDTPGVSPMAGTHRINPEGHVRAVPGRYDPADSNRVYIITLPDVLQAQIDTIAAHLEYFENNIFQERGYEWVLTTAEEEADALEKPTAVLVDRLTEGTFPGTRCFIQSELYEGSDLNQTGVRGAQYGLVRWRGTGILVFTEEMLGLIGPLGEQDDGGQYTITGSSSDPVPGERLLTSADPLTDADKIMLLYTGAKRDPHGAITYLLSP